MGTKMIVERKTRESGIRKDICSLFMYVYKKREYNNQKKISDKEPGKKQQKKYKKYKNVNTLNMKKKKRT